MTSCLRSIAVAALLLGPWGCDSEPEEPQAEQTTGEEIEEGVDEAVDETEEAVDEAGDGIEEGADEAEDEVDEAF